LGKVLDILIEKGVGEVWEYPGGGLKKAKSEFLKETGRTGVFARIQ